MSLVKTRLRASRRGEIPSTVGVRQPNPYDNVRIFLECAIYQTHVSIDRFSKCGLIDSQYFEKGKHFFLDLQSEKTQHERLLKRHNGKDNEYIQIIRKEYVYQTFGVKAQCFSFGIKHR